MIKFDVSVIIPTFNRPEYLAEAVRSVLEQTRTVLEIVIIDNGSDAGHWDKLSEIENWHDSIRLIRLQSNRGAGYARNEGIAESLGDWLLFLDDDDLLSPDFIETCFNSLQSDDRAEIIIGRAVGFEKGALVSYPADAIGAVNLEAYKKDPVTFLIVNGMAVGSCMLKRGIVGPLRFEPDIWHGEDTIFWFSMMHKIKTLAIADGAFVGIRRHSGKMTLMRDSVNPDGSQALAKETYIKRMIESAAKTDSWTLFALRIIFQRIADDTWYSPSLLLLLLGNPLFGLRLVFILANKRFFRYRMALSARMSGKAAYDIKWLQRKCL